MFCGICGSENDVNAKFCSRCGSILNNSQITENNLIVENTKINSLYQYNRKRQIRIIAIVVIVIVVVAIVVGSSNNTGRSYEKVIDKYSKALCEGDTKTMMSLIPKEIVDYGMESNGYDYDELFDAIDEVMKEAAYYYNYYLECYVGDHWKTSYEILYTEDIIDNDLESLKRRYEKANVKLSAAKKVSAEFTFKGKEMEANDMLEVYVIKVGRSWYLDLVNMFDL